MKKISLIDCGSRYIQELQGGLEVGGVRVKRIRYEELSWDAIEDADGVVISGSPNNLTEIDKDEVIRAFQPLKTIQKPVLGVCYGHQVLGILYGSRIWKGGEIVREVEIRLLKADELFAGFEEKFPMAERHEEYVSLPEGFELLANSDTAAVEAMKHQNLPLYGVQFHPEISGHGGVHLIQNFLKIAMKS